MLVSQAFFMAGALHLHRCRGTLSCACAGSEDKGCLVCFPIVAVDYSHMFPHLEMPESFLVVLGGLDKLWFLQRQKLAIQLDVRSCKPGQLILLWALSQQW